MLDLGIIRIELGNDFLFILGGLLLGHLMGALLLVLGMYGAIPRWLRGAWLGLAWAIAVVPQFVGFVVENWRPHVLFFVSLTPIFGVIIATLAARYRTDNS